MDFNDNISKEERISKLSEKLTSIQNNPSETSILKHKIQKFEITIQEMKESLISSMDSFESLKIINDKLILRLDNEKKERLKLEERLKIIEVVIPDLEQLLKLQISNQKPEINIDFNKIIENVNILTENQNEFEREYYTLKNNLFNDLQKIDLKIKESNNNDRTITLIQGIVNNINSELKVIYDKIDEESNNREESINKMITSYEEFIKKVKTEFDMINEDKKEFEDDVFKLFNDFFNRIN